MGIGARTVEKEFIIGDIVNKEKNYCDKCKKMTWHDYNPTTKEKDGYTECNECQYKRFFDNLKYRKPSHQISSYKWR